MIAARRSRTSLLVLLLTSAALGATACREARKAEGLLAGKATVSGTTASAEVGQAPRVAYVGDFTVDPGAIKSAGGLFGAAEQMVAERPHVLGGGLLGGGGGGGSGGEGEGSQGGGILDRRMSGDRPTAQQVSDVLANSIVRALNAEQLGFPAERLPSGYPVPSNGWLIHGSFENVDPGNRAQRAVIGFGAGEATTEVDVIVDRLSAAGATPVLQFGTQADSGKAPGAAVTMNPYAAAAKFVLGRNATQRDVEKMGQAIAKEIAKYARERGVAPPASS
jgi:hypothetical protein